MLEKIKCPKCGKPDPENLHAESNINSPAEGEKPFPKSKKSGPKYECRNCGHRF
ncbi:MAG: hypothetical protein HQ555_11750 [Candidatus Aminicenantes bacterium]|nr:hypothetical protein [Candidatus Aminicenantes bacterium]